MLGKLFIINIIVFLFFILIEVAFDGNKGKEFFDNLNALKDINVILFFVLLILIILFW